jgi:aminopeptidase N
MSISLMNLSAKALSKAVLMKWQNKRLLRQLPLLILLLLTRSQHLPAQQKLSPAFTDVTYYKIELQLDTLHREASGRVTIRLNLQNRQSPWIRLDLTDSAKVFAISINGRAATYQHRNGKLDISLDAQNQKLKALSIVCRYSVPFLENGLHLVRWQDKATICTYGVPYSAKEWWPCKDLPSDKADSADIFIRVPRPLIVASNGRLIDVTSVPSEGGNGTEDQFHWKVIHPIYPDVISLAVANYSQFNIQDKDVTFNFYVFTQDLENAKTDFPVLTEMLRSHEHYFGVYPFKNEKYGVAEFTLKSYREHQTIPSLGFNFMTGKHSADRVLAHELAHQWFGNSLTVKNWQQIWLNESFCNYAYALWMEYSTGKQGYQDAMNKYDRPDFSGPVLLSDSTNVDTMFTPTTFCKGAWVLHMLRNVMGDDAFFKALTEYASIYRYKNVETADFQAVCERDYKQSLKWFFDEWLLGVGRPVYSYKYKSVSDKDKWRLTLSIEQLQQDDPAYKMPVDLQFRLKNGENINRTVLNDKRQQAYTFVLNARCDTVIIDPGHKILEKLVFKSN